MKEALKAFQATECQPITASEARALMYSDLKGDLSRTILIAAYCAIRASAKRKMAWLYGTTNYPSIYDTANITLTTLTTDIDPKDPAANPDTAPTGFTIDACSEEVIDGAVTKWMTDGQGVFAASLIVAVTQTYSGSDAATLALFQGQGNGVVGTRTDYIHITGTNAATQTYSQLTSLQPSEPVPVGNAQNLFNTLNALHQQGTLELTEEECSGLLQAGCVFNTSDGLAEWQAMNALVLSVRENIDKGVTTVEFGPTLMLGLQELVELARANRGRVFTYSLAQRTTGKAGTANAVIGHTHGANNHISSPPGGGSAQVGPFTVIWGPKAGSPGVFDVLVKENGLFLKSPVLSDTITVSNLNTKMNLNANDTIWLEGGVTDLASNGTAAIKSFGNGDGGYNPAAAAFVSGGVVEGDGASPPNQTLFRKAIAVFVADGSGKPSLQTQTTTTNLVLKNTYMNGACIYPVPL